MSDMSDNDREPAAWLAYAVHGSDSCAVYLTDGEARAAAEAWGWQVAPLFFAPTLTDAEREAVRLAADAYDLDSGDAGCEAIAATLRGLLERTVEK